MSHVLCVLDEGKILVRCAAHEKATQDLPQQRLSVQGNHGGVEQCEKSVCRCRGPQ
jgi:hypothetical protein